MLNYIDVILVIEFLMYLTFCHYQYIWYDR